MQPSVPAYWDAQVMMPALTDAERALRDAFVDEYLKDFDAWAAAVRVGFMKTVASQYAQDFMQEPYVLQQITAKQLARDTQNADDALRAKQAQIESALLREAHYKGPGSSHSARVTALAQLAKMNKMGGGPDEDGAMNEVEALVKAFREMAQKVPV